MNWLSKLQNKPYKTRVRYLWGGVMIAGVIIFAIWLVTLKLRAVSEETPEQYSRFEQIWNDIKNINNPNSQNR